MTALLPTDRRTAASPTTTTRLGPTAARAARLRRGLLVAAPIGLLLSVGLLLGAGGANYWRYIAAEDTPMTWLQSVALVLCGATAAMLSLVDHLAGRGSSRVWLLLAVGFAGLGLDDRFAVHERLRDRVLAKIDIALPWGAPGDYVLLLIAAAGLILLPRVLRVIAVHRTSRALFLSGVGLTLLALGLDSINPDSLSVDVERFEQTGEEILELSSQLLFLLALSVRLVDELARPSVVELPDTESPAPPPSAPPG